MADDRILATVLFTDIVDSTSLAAKMGDRDWHALLSDDVSSGRNWPALGVVR